MERDDGLEWKSTNFQELRCQLKMLGSRNVTWSKFHTEFHKY
jgi:hypothetical protein